MWLYCVFSPSNRKCEIMESNLVRSSSLIHSLGIYELCNFGQVTSQRFKFFFGKLVRAFFIDKFALSSSEAFFFQMESNIEADQCGIILLKKKVVLPLPHSFPPPGSPWSISTMPPQARTASTTSLPCKGLRWTFLELASSQQPIRTRPKWLH